MSAHELTDLIRKHGVCPAADACEKPDAELADCAGCLAAWAALDALDVKLMYLALDPST